MKTVDRGTIADIAVAIKWPDDTRQMVWADRVGKR